MRDLVVVGAGGFGRETIDTVRAINNVRPTWQLRGVVDDALSSANAARLSALGVPHLGSLRDLPEGVSVAVAVGSPAARSRIVEMLAALDLDYPALIHPSTVIGSSFGHGAGLITLAGVSIGTNVRLGEHVHLNAHAAIGHDTRLGDCVSVNPSATVSGECTLASGVLVGAGSTVLQGMTLGEAATVGAAACVVKDVPAAVTVKGVPAR